MRIIRPINRGQGGALATTGTALKVNGSGQVTANSTVNISVFPGTESAAIDASTDNSGSSTALLTASGEVDYMYADQTSTPKASYKKGVSAKDGKLTLSMKPCPCHGQLPGIRGSYL